MITQSAIDRHRLQVITNQPSQRLRITGITTRQMPVKTASLLVRLGGLDVQQVPLDLRLGLDRILQAGTEGAHRYHSGHTSYRMRW